MAAAVVTRGAWNWRCIVVKAETCIFIRQGFAVLGLSTLWKRLVWNLSKKTAEARESASAREFRKPIEAIGDINCSWCRLSVTP